MSDPFDGIPEARADEVEVRPRWAKVEPKPLDPLGNSGAKPKRVDLNPLERRWLETHGYTFSRVEHANAWGSVTVDLWGVGDYLAVHPERREILLVQVTTASNAATRLRKAEKCPELRVWLAAGGRFEVHAWSQPGGPGTRWQLERRELER